MLTIVRNLLQNAIKASPQKGIITITYEPHICLEITNQGIAFTHQNYLDALNKSETSQLLNGGLGLQIVDELSRKIKLSVSYKTNAKDEETCCTIRFEK
jgi:signal transduction histidine kinase